MEQQTKETNRFSSKLVYKMTLERMGQRVSKTQEKILCIWHCQFLITSPNIVTWRAAATPTTDETTNKTKNDHLSNDAHTETHLHTYLILYTQIDLFTTCNITRNTDKNDADEWESNCINNNGTGMAWIKDKCRQLMFTTELSMYLRIFTSDLPNFWAENKTHRNSICKFIIITTIVYLIMMLSLGLPNSCMKSFYSDVLCSTSICITIIDQMWSMNSGISWRIIKLWAKIEKTY